MQEEYHAPINDFICIKLGKSVLANGSEVDGQTTMQIYERHLKGHASVWFSTDSLHTGMSKERVSHYNELINDGNDVRILFAYSDDKRNDIQYSARIKEVKSYEQPTIAPDLMLPDEYYGEHKRIWIKITDLQKEDKISAKSFIIDSTGRNLQEIMSTSQFHFGYVKLK